MKCIADLRGLVLTPETELENDVLKQWEQMTPHVSRPVTDIEFDQEILRLLERSGRKLAVIVAEHRDSGIYAKAYGDGDLAGKFSLTTVSASHNPADEIIRRKQLQAAGDRRDWDECNRLEGQ